MSARDFDVIDAVLGLQERGWVVVSPAELRAGYRILGAEQGAALDRLTARAEAWKHNSDSARVSVRLGDLRSLASGESDG